MRILWLLTFVLFGIGFALLGKFSKSDNPAEAILWAMSVLGVFHIIIEAVFGWAFEERKSE
jgi:hypothetical protein